MWARLQVAGLALLPPQKATRTPVNVAVVTGICNMQIHLCWPTFPYPACVTSQHTVAGVQRQTAVAQQKDGITKHKYVLLLFVSWEMHAPACMHSLGCAP